MSQTIIKPKRYSDVDRTIEVDGKLYYNVPTFARITKRSELAIRLLMTKGNRLRSNLLHIKHFNAVLIPIDELANFPFTCAGKSRLVIRFTATGSEYSEIIK